MKPLNILSPAKINWFLRINQRRLDNYHDIQSLMQCIDLVDNIRLTRTDKPKIHLSVSRPLHMGFFLGVCERAAIFLRQITQCRYGVKIDIQKNIPIGAGLGGGSSNAAAILLGLNRLWKINMPVQQLLTIAGRLGSDVPFFVRSTSAWVEGWGERIIPWRPIDTPLAIFVRKTPTSTADCYNSHDFRRKASQLEFTNYRRRPILDLVKLGNIFEDSVAKKDEEIALALKLASQFGHSFMTGTGSGVVTLLDRDAQLDTKFIQNVHKKLASEDKLENWDVLWSRSCQRSPLHASMGLTNEVGIEQVS